MYSISEVKKMPVRDERLRQGREGNQQTTGTWKLASGSISGATQSKVIGSRNDLRNGIFKKEFQNWIICKPSGKKAGGKQGDNPSTL